jgi:hypothetical protein
VLCGIVQRLVLHIRCETKEVYNSEHC